MEIASRLGPVDGLIFRVWARAKVDPLPVIQTQWTVGDLMLATDQLALDRLLEEEARAKA